jgi:hypothetical protein
MCVRSLKEDESLSYTTDTKASGESNSTEIAAPLLREKSVLVKRHNYAMTCLDDSIMTAICGSEGYFCNSIGKLEKKKDSKGDADCAEKGVCTCVNLFPQPKCFWKASGMMMCGRDAPQVPTVNISTARAILEKKGIRTLAKRHIYAMSCKDDSIMTRICSEEGYYCDANGKVQHKKVSNSDPDCVKQGFCYCVNLFPQPRCFWAGSGMMCGRNVPQVDSSSLSISTSISKRDTGTLVKRHNWAMKCWDSSVMTALCNGVGYYSDKDGKLQLKKGIDVADQQDYPGDQEEDYEIAR